MNHHIIDNPNCGIPEFKKNFYDVLIKIPKKNRKTAIELGAYCGSTSSILCNLFNKLCIVEDYSIFLEKHTNTNSYNIGYKNNTIEIDYIDIINEHKHLNHLDTLKYNLKNFNNYVLYEESFEKFNTNEKYDFVFDDTFDTAKELSINFILKNKNRLIKAFELVNGGGLYCLGWNYWIIKNISNNNFIKKLILCANKKINLDPSFL